MLLAPTFLGEKIYQGGKTWLIFPDLKVCFVYKRGEFSCAIINYICLPSTMF